MVPRYLPLPHDLLSILIVGSIASASYTASRLSSGVELRVGGKEVSSA